MVKKLSILGIFVASTALGLAVQVTFSGKIAPGTFALNSNISFEDVETVQEDLSLALEEYESKPVQVSFEGVSYEFSLNELGVSLSKTDTVESLPVMSPITIFGNKEVKALFQIDEELMEEALNKKIINLNVAPSEPVITWNSALQDFNFTEEKSGWAGDLQAFKEDLSTQISVLENSPLEITAVLVMPTLTKVKLESSKEELRDKVITPIEIFSGEDGFELNWLDNQHLLNFEPDENGEIKIKIDRDILSEHLDRYIAPEVGVAPENVTIIQDEEGNISFEGTAVDGLSLDTETMVDMLSYALNNGLKKVEIPLVETVAEVDVPAALQELGIKELVVTGYSSFYGSTYNRMHNIRTAIAHFDGALVASGETFSFGDQLGVVDGSTGYAKELVIKENETIPEYGGGVCQVSSTLFRAVLFGGFPIDERKAHTYAVSYYAYPLGWGLDATVYPPAVDLKFTNDSDTYLLMQAYTDGYLAYLKFYGTKDGRAVQMDGPYISNRAGAPEPIYTVTPDLAPGEIDQVDSAHNGFSAAWTRQTTYPNGTVREESIVSPYTPWPARYLVGEGTEGY